MVRTLKKLCLVYLLFLFSIPAAYSVGNNSFIKNARKLAWQGKYKESIQAYEQLIKRDPKDVEAMIGLATVLSWHKRYDEATSYYKKALKVNPNAVGAELGILTIRSWKGEYKPVIKELELLAEKHPKSPGIFILLGRVTSWDGQFKKSVKYYKRALELSPNNTEVLVGLGNTYKWMGNMDEGVAFFDKALQKDPNNVETLISVGVLYSNGGKQKKAIEYLEHASKLAPERQDIHAMLSTLYGSANQLDDAITELQKSIALNEDNLANYVALGRILSWQNKADEAIKLYKEALRKDPKNTDAMVGLGNTYFYIDEWDKAEEMFEMALQVKPQEIDAQKGLDKLKRAKAPEITLGYQFYDYRDYYPARQTLGTRLYQNIETINYTQRIIPTLKLQVRYRRDDQKQIDKTDGSTDFKIGNNIASVGLDWKLPKDYNIRFRYDFNQFKDDGAYYYDMVGTHYDHSGFFIFSKQLSSHYFSVIYGRELYIYPYKDSAANFLAEVAAIDSFGLTYQYQVSRCFSLMLAPSLSHYNLPSGHFRQDYIFRPELRLPFFDKIKIAYILRYRSNPAEANNGGHIAFQDTIGRKFLYELSYGADYDNYLDYIQHNVGLFFTYDIASWIAWTISANVGVQQLEDSDLIQNYQTYIKLRF